MDASNPNLAPLLHPRRDPLLRRARLGAAGVCAVANGVMFWLGLRAVSRGVELSLASVAVFCAALLVVGTRLPVVVELWLGGIDRDEDLENAPPAGEIAQRAIVGVVLPWSFAVFALTRLGDVVAGFWSLIALLALDAIWRFGGFSTWRGPHVETPILKAALLGDAQGGALAFAQAPMLSSREFEAAAMVVASLAIRTRSEGALDVLLGVARRRQECEGDDPRVRRTLLILEADRARMDDAIDASETEARALRETRAGHPRRLSLALFVATAALETDQPRAAVDALSMLHSRDAMPSGARVVVNWLLAEAARRAGNDAIAERCRAALATFDVRREAAAIGEEGIGADAHETDPYAKWMAKAKGEMMGKKEGMRD